MAERLALPLCLLLRRTFCRLARLQRRFEPIPHISDTDTDVVDLAVVIATFLAAEDLQGLLLRADGVEAFLGQGQRYLLIALAVQDHERAFDFLYDAVELERLELLQH